MAEIFLCKKGSITPASVTRLHKAGVIVVQADKPEDCKFIRSGELVTGSQMLSAALRALASQPQTDKATTATNQRQSFVDFMTELVNAQMHTQQNKP